ncbi:unnamed protein product, partial [Brassica oleracea]
MAHRRISSAEKGKGLDLSSQLPLRTAIVKTPAPDNSDLLRKHHLTLIGRVTNKSVQKVWSLIPFFTDHWKTEFKLVGADLGNGMFQFQFELEADLLSVLEKRPYHYARWMVILQRWEPTISPKFPSLIPFWIKVQGLPVHLWTEAKVKCIGEDIGLYEKAEITAVSARMRVHVDGLFLVLVYIFFIIFFSIICSFSFVFQPRVFLKCIDRCVKAHKTHRSMPHKPIDRCVKASQEEAMGKSNNGENQRVTKEASQIQSYEVRSSVSKDREYRKENTPRESYKKEHQAAYHQREDRRYGQNPHSYREGKESWRDIGRNLETSSRYHLYQTRENYSNTSRLQVYREVRRLEPEVRQSVRGPEEHGPLYNATYTSCERVGLRGEESSSSKALASPTARGSPLQREHNQIDKGALEEALGEVRETMAQYTKCAGPTKSAARQERLRQAEEKCQLEETTARMVRASLNKQISPPVRENYEAPSSPAGRVPAALRLGIPIEDLREGQETLKMQKRKPGRPSGKRKFSNSPKVLIGASSRKRKVQSAKPPLCRR